MSALISLSRFVDRRLGNTGLGVIAAVIFFLSVTGAASQWGSSTSTPAATRPTTTTVVVSTTVTTALATTTTVLASTTLASVAQVARNGLDGYAAVNLTVTPLNKTAKKLCGLLAASSSQQATGFMNRRDLAGYDAMVFPFQADTNASFYMANVPVALSVAWFDKSGKFVSSADMEPCKTDVAKCQLYSAQAPYRTAIETLKGGLGALGIGTGSVLSVGTAGPC